MKSFKYFESIYYIKDSDNRSIQIDSGSYSELQNSLKKYAYGLHFIVFRCGWVWVNITLTPVLAQYHLKQSVHQSMHNAFLYD